MTNRLRVSAALLVGVLATVLGAAPTIAAPKVSVHCEQGASLQAAIVAANPGDTLSVSGTCVGNFTIAKNLNLTAKGTAILDGSRTDSVVYVSSGVVVSITGFTITNGLGFDSKAGGVTNFGALTLNSVTVSGNNATSVNDSGLGGIATFYPGVLTMNNSVISGNTAGNANVGGLFVFGPQPSGTSGPVAATLNNTTVSGNTGGIGGIEAHGVMVLSSSKVIGNTGLRAGGRGGVEFDSNMTITNSTISGNLPCNFSCPNG